MQALFAPDDHLVSTCPREESPSLFSSLGNSEAARGFPSLSASSVSSVLLQDVWREEVGPHVLENELEHLSSKHLGEPELEVKSVECLDPVFHILPSFLLSSTCFLLR